MAVTMNGKGASDGFEAITKGFKKEYGEAVGGENPPVLDIERIPTDILPLDIALGGGIPRGRITEIFGAESSGKTNLLLKLIASHQRLWPEKKNAIFNIEGTLDKAWAARMGVDVSKLYIFEPDYAEQCIDMVEQLLMSPECGIVGLDSLAALITIREASNSAEKSDVGGSGLAGSKMIKKAVSTIIGAGKAGHHPSFVIVNQTRMKIGVMFGDPTTTPGGNSPKYAASCRIQVYGKNVMDAKVSKVMPVRKHTSAVIKKWKFPITATNCEWEMAMLPHNGLGIGQCVDFPLVKSHLESAGLFYKDEATKGYVVCGTPFKTITQVRDEFLSNPAFADELKALVYKAALDGLGSFAEEGDHE